jgi:beta-phosphoglucomutase-like phosphatase (HAD superfamily)
VPRAVLLDVDGTLIDANYQHALAWYRAFHRHGIVLPVWRIHRHVGMGGDQLVPALVGRETDEEQGDRIRDTRDELYRDLIGEVEPLEGARELIVDLKERSTTTSIFWTPASSRMRGRRTTTSRPRSRNPISSAPHSAEPALTKR